jgi:hypothetical protein
MELGGDPIEIGKEYMTSNYMMNGNDVLLHYIVSYDDAINYHVSNELGLDLPARLFYFVKKI